jgi:hypothetical protein
MSARISYVTLLMMPITLAVAQQTSPAKPADSSPPAKADSPSSRPHVHLGGVYSGAPYYGYSAGFWGYPHYPYGPFFFPPFAPGFATGFAYRPNMGEVKIQTSHKAAQVYIDGGFAGQAGHLKNMWLEPGVHNFEVHDGPSHYAQRLYVLSGKTLKLTPELMEQVGRP